MPLLADERVVAAPGIDAKAFEARSRGAVERAPHLEPEPQDVPVQRAVLPDRLVRESMDLTDVEDAGSQPADDSAAAFGAEIERQELSTH